ncbi:MAG: phospholipase [Flavobacteriales bacterium]|nr:MAG: phospholipase [Flavobacteriales bacterium]
MKELSLKYLIRKPKINTEHPPLLLLLHGYGSNEADLFSFADELPDECLVISARAPLPMTFGGYAWYTIHFDSTNGKFSDDEEAVKSRELIKKFLDEIITEYNVNTAKVFLVGFSQGTILSYAVALNYPQKVNYVVGLSGYINPDLLPVDIKKEDVNHLEIYTSHGTQDQVIPVTWARKTKPFLDSLDVKNTYQEFPVGHGVAPQNFYNFKQWIQDRL